MTVNPSDFELGDEVEVERRPRVAVVVSVRLTPEEADALQAFAAERGLTLSRAVREAIRAHLKPVPPRHTPKGSLTMGTWPEESPLRVTISDDLSGTRTSVDNPIELEPIPA